MRTKKLLLLITSLLILILAPPLLEKGTHLESGIHSFITTLALITTIYTSHGRGKMLIVGILFAIPMLGFHIAALLTESFIIDVLNLGFKVLFFSLVIYQLIRAIIGSRYKLSDKIWGAVGVYLLIGLAWARVYMLCSLFIPNAITDSNGKALQSVIEMNYFSFSTLTTVGYGDILPQDSFVRALSSIEAIIGMLFLATWMAVLVGAYGSEKK